MWQEAAYLMRLESPASSNKHTSTILMAIIINSYAHVVSRLYLYSKLFFASTPTLQSVVTCILMLWFKHSIVLIPRLFICIYTKAHKDSCYFFVMLV